jgi:flavin-dependent dehydrogenase
VSPDSCEVLVVGGGPAGSTCAWQLQRMGLDVLVIDKQRFPRDKVCAGWVTPAVLEELQLDRQDYARGRVLQPLTGFRTGMMGSEPVETRYPQAVSYGIRRCEFDTYLLGRCGARRRLGEGFSHMRRAGGDWLVNDAIRARVVVGAGGHFCPVARFLGARPGSGEPGVAAKEIEFLMNEEQRRECRVAAHTPELTFCRDLKGYGWVFRKGDYLNIGLGRQDTHGLGGHVEAFVDDLRHRGRVPAELPKRLHGHAYLLYGDAPRPLLDDAVLLVGDAAGLAYAQSGEGIRPAIESGLLAARVLAQAGGDYRRSRLAPYAALLEKRFGARDRRRSLAMNRLLPAGVSRFLGHRLLSNAWFSRHLVLDRWFFHAHQAALPSSESV